MKIKHIIAIISSLAVVSCSYLEFDETTNTSEIDDLYNTFSKAKQMLTDVYSYVPQYSGFVGAGLDLLAMHDCASDDAEYGSVSATVQNVNNGSWSAINTYDDQWTLYNGVRSANLFLDQYPLIRENLEKYWRTAATTNYLIQTDLYDEQARILRAYFFFELARRYGDIAMPLSVLTEESANEIQETKFDDVIAFIVNECDECAQELPCSYAAAKYATEYGRVTRGFALALKTKALLYAASPLHNPSNDASKWDAVIKAAQELIDLKDDDGNQVYSLDKDRAYLSNSSDDTAFLSPELVFSRRSYNANGIYELYNFPLQFSFGGRASNLISCTNYPSQNLVDAFETSKGYRVTLVGNQWITNQPDFDQSAPYKDRDPRFALSILYDGASLKGVNIDIAAGGVDAGTVGEGYTPTGYYVRKYLYEDANFNPEIAAEASSYHHWILYRLSEAYLTIAEAMAMKYGNGTSKSAGESMSALEAVNAVRANAGMPDARLEEYDNDIMALVRNEWRVEFAFEDHRFWDVRRWKIGDDTQRVLYGVEITKSTNGKTYRKTVVENRVWSERMNLYPVPQKERYINANLHQNTGW